MFQNCSDFRPQNSLRLASNQSEEVDTISPSPTPASTASPTPTPSPVVNGSGEGFGADTAGGTGKTVFVVSNLNDSGSGSLRDALSGGNRTVQFAVSGTIRLSTPIGLKGSHITIDGATAPGTGIIISNYGLTLSGVSHVIIRHIRIRDMAAEEDGITIWNKTNNVLVDHVSVAKARDGAIDVTEGSYDITVQNSVLAETLDGSKATLIKFGEPHNISFHHNVYVGNAQRMPLVSGCLAGEAGSEYRTCTEVKGTTLDFRNNVIFGFDSAATWIDTGAHVNIVNNYYSSPASTLFKQGFRAITVDSATDARAYVSGNRSGDPITDDINRASVPKPEATPFAFSPVTTQDACSAARLAVAESGAQPRDAIDRAYMENIRVNCNCAGDCGLRTWSFEIHLPRNGDPALIRTRDLLLRRQLLYPTELRDLG